MPATEGAALVGHTGFVGSNLARQHRFDGQYNSRNIGDITGGAFDLLVFSGAQSKKWWANQHPDEDWAAIQGALGPLASVRAGMAVLISTIDVIPVTESANGEDADCDSQPTHAYGRNRRALEKAFAELFPDALIVRLPALFGPGLKKNVLYDLLHDNLLDKINAESSFQYYDLTRLWSDIVLAMGQGLKIVHLFPEPLATGQIVDRFFPGKAIGGDAAPVAHYDYRTRHGRVLGGTDRYIEDAAGVLARLEDFFRTAPRGGQRVKLAFSNIAWDAAEEADALALLARAGIRGLEVAPTKCWPDWKGITPQSVTSVRQSLAQAGFEIPSMQAILFGQPGLKLFGDAAALDGLLRHIELVAEMAQGLGAKTLVFGAPANRDPGDLTPEQAMDMAVPRLRAMGEACARHGVWLGIEANPADYNCRFMTRWFEAAELVRRCASPGVKLHLDAACTLLAGDDIVEAVEKSADILAHVHVSEPQLGNFDAPQSDHARFAEELRRIGYQGWCSVEMRRDHDAVAAVRRASEVALTHYG